VASLPPEVEVEIRLNGYGLDHPSAIFDSQGTWRLYSSASHYCLVVSGFAGSPGQVLALDKDLRYGQLFCGEAETERALSPFTLIRHPFAEVLYVNVLAHRKLGALLHACAVDAGGRGLAFVGKSGAGKSTTARLWQQRGDATVLCDDRIIVRQMEGAFRAYGTPWHGDVPAVSPASAPLERILFIRHGAENRLTPLRPAEAVSRLMGCVFTTWWDPEGLAFTLSFLEELARAVLCYAFAFRPEPEALDAVLAL